MSRKPQQSRTQAGKNMAKSQQGEVKGAQTQENQAGSRTDPKNLHQGGSTSGSKGHGNR